MTMRHSLARLCGFIPLTLLLLAAGLASAQDAETCAAAAANAVSQLAGVCGSAQANTACYGSSAVTAGLSDGTAPASFSQRGDRIDLDSLDTLQTSAADPTTGTYGIALMDLRADLPQALAQQSVKLAAFGGLTVENRVTPDTLFAPGHGFDTTLTSAADLLAAPLATSDVITSIPAQASVSLDAVTDDGDWVRTVYQSQPGWLRASALDAGADVSALAKWSADRFTPMQSFALSQTAASPCDGAPSFLLAQAPENALVNLRVQDVPVRLDSTALMRVVPSSDDACGALELTTVYGLATLYPDTTSPVYVPPGYTASAPIPCDASGAVDATTSLTSADWSSPEPAQELTLENLSLVEKVPQSLLNAAVQLPMVIRASGRSVVAFINFPDPNAVSSAQKLCARGTLPENVCRTLGM